jgi:ssDNA-binding Zn-finger/Zn-ribbon topoisomerase 1
VRKTKEKCPVCGVELILEVGHYHSKKGYKLIFSTGLEKDVESALNKFFKRI